MIKTHSKFVQDVKYAPSGDYFASVGSDAKIFLYDGKTGDTIAEITEDAHSGTIVSIESPSYCAGATDANQTACSWSPDSKSFSTSSVDRTVKLCKHSHLLPYQCEY